MGATITRSIPASSARSSASSGDTTAVVTPTVFSIDDTETSNVAPYEVNSPKPRDVNATDMAMEDIEDEVSRGVTKLTETVKL